MPPKNELERQSGEGNPRFAQGLEQFDRILKLYAPDTASNSYLQRNLRYILTQNPISHDPAASLAVFNRLDEKSFSKEIYRNLLRNTLRPLAEAGFGEKPDYQEPTFELLRQYYQHFADTNMAEFYEFVEGDLPYHIATTNGIPALHTYFESLSALGQNLDDKRLREPRMSKVEAARVARSLLVDGKIIDFEKFVKQEPTNIYGGNLSHDDHFRAMFILELAGIEGKLLAGNDETGDIEAIFNNFSGNSNPHDTFHKREMFVDWESHQMIAETLQQKGLPERAISQLEHIAGNYMYRDNTGLAAAKIAGLLALAGYHEKKGNPERARELFGEAVDLGGNGEFIEQGSDYYTALKVNTWKELVMMLIERGQTEKALEITERTGKIRSGNYRDLTAYGYALLAAKAHGEERSKMLSEALESHRLAYPKDRDFSLLLYNLELWGEISEEKREYCLDREDFEEVIIWKLTTELFNNEITLQQALAQIKAEIRSTDQIDTVFRLAGKMADKAEIISPDEGKSRTLDVFSNEIETAFSNLFTAEYEKSTIMGNKWFESFLRLDARHFYLFVFEQSGSGHESQATQMVERWKNVMEKRMHTLLAERKKTIKKELYLLFYDPLSAAAQEALTYLIPQFANTVKLYIAAGMLV